VSVGDHHTFFACDAHCVGEKAFSLVCIYSNMVILNLYFDNSRNRGQADAREFNAPSAL
jgi:hypothetical protein